MISSPRPPFGDTTATQINHEASTGFKDIWEGLTGIAQGALGVAKLVDMAAMGTGVAAIEAISFVPAMGIAMFSSLTVPQVLKEATRFANNPIAARAAGYGVLALTAGLTLKA